MSQNLEAEEKGVYVSPSKEVVAKEEDTGRPTSQHSKGFLNQPSKEILIQPSKEILFQPSKEILIQPSKEILIQPSKEILTQSPLIQPSKEILIQPSKEILIQPSKEILTQSPLIQPSKEILIQPSKEILIQPSKEILIQPSKEILIQPSKEILIHPSKEILIQPSKEIIIQPSKENLIQSSKEIIPSKGSQSVTQFELPKAATNEISERDGSSKRSSVQIKDRPRISILKSSQQRVSTNEMRESRRPSRVSIISKSKSKPRQTTDASQIEVSRRKSQLGTPSAEALQEEMERTLQLQASYVSMTPVHSARPSIVTSKDISVLSFAKLRSKVLRTSRIKSMEGSVLSMQRHADVDRSKIPKYMNTYRLESKNPFNPDRVNQLIRNFVDKELEGVKYEPIACAKLSLTLSAEIRARVKVLGFDRYKLISLVEIIEKNMQSIYSTASFLWDATRDNYAYYKYENTYLYAIISVFGVYYE